MKSSHLVGQRFGELTVVRELSDLKDTLGRRWLCRCDCGGEAIRSTAALNRAVKLGHVPSCRRCLEELAGGRRADARAQRRELLREQYAEWGTLWTCYQTDRLMRQVAADLAAEFGPTVAPEATDAVGTEVVSEPSAPAATQQRLGDMVRVGPLEDAAWGCVHCHGLVDAGWGCLVCTEVACQRCVAEERHVHREGGATLDEVAAALGVSRERARGIEQKALRKLRERFWSVGPECDYDLVPRLPVRLARIFCWLPEAV